MRVSQRLDYAVRLLVLLAAQPPGEHVVVGDLAERIGLPRRFAEQQVSVLARAGIVRCRRGASGGCTLGRANTGGSFVGGSLDESRIYSRRLTAEEITQLSNWPR